MPHVLFDEGYPDQMAPDSGVSRSQLLFLGTHRTYMHIVKLPHSTYEQACRRCQNERGTKRTCHKSSSSRNFLIHTLFSIDYLKRNRRKYELWAWYVNWTIDSSWNHKRRLSPCYLLQEQYVCHPPRMESNWLAHGLERQLLDPSVRYPSTTSMLQIHLRDLQEGKHDGRLLSNSRRCQSWIITRSEQ